MADDPHSNNTQIPDQVVVEPKEDAETAAAREELKHAAISETKLSAGKQERPEKPDEPAAGTAGTAAGIAAGQQDTDMLTTRPGKAAGPPTPRLAPAQLAKPDDACLASPKKKRAHDEVEEEHRDPAEETADVKNKRPRDEKSPPAEIHNRNHIADAARAVRSETALSPKDDDATSRDAADKKPVAPAATSTPAFAASGFAKLANSSSSPFASLGASKSVFGGGGGGSGSGSSFASFGGAAIQKKPAAAAAPPKLSDTGPASPFASLNGSAKKTFGSAFGGSPFASAFGGGKITNFGKPGEVLKSDKPARPFGAPESEAEEDGDEDSEEKESAEDAESPEKERDESAKDDSKSAPEEERKVKYKKVEVDDGEAGEVTIMQVRAKMYFLDKVTDKDGHDEMAWKERGAGNLKINVPSDSVELEEDGSPLPDTFDASVLEADSHAERPRVVRLIMRQDQTLRVILNTAVLRGMNLQKKEGMKSSSILFTALEGEDGRHVQVQMKMNHQNANHFMDIVEKIQHEMAVLA